MKFGFSKIAAISLAISFACINGFAANSIPTGSSSSAPKTMTFKKGWNMVSENYRAVSVDFLKSNGITAVWGWDIDKQAYFAPVTFQSYQAYWVKAPVDLNVDISSMPLQKERYVYQYGPDNWDYVETEQQSILPNNKWALFSARSNLTIFDSIKNRLFTDRTSVDVWSYDANLSNYVGSGYLHEFGRGFWLKVGDYNVSMSTGTTNINGTVWEDSPHCTQIFANVKTYREAQTYCASLGMRLPTFDEANILYSENNKSSNALLKHSVSSNGSFAQWGWTSTIDANNSDRMMMLDASLRYAPDTAEQQALKFNSDNYKWVFGGSYAWFSQENDELMAYYKKVAELGNKKYGKAYVRCVKGK